jgi:uncharacterized protein (UPF0332 family)
MSLHADLLEQAEHLAQLDSRRPRMANLRRAVSSAYYALFHLLAAEVAALYASEPALAARIVRTLNHADMKKSSLMIASNKLPKAVQPPTGSYSAPVDLKTVAGTFVKLQQARHEADYDLSRSFRRQEALAFVQSARQAFAAWERLRKTDDARLYLACFHLWKRWDDDPR